MTQAENPLHYALVGEEAFRRTSATYDVAATHHRRGAVVFDQASAQGLGQTMVDFARSVGRGEVSSNGGGQVVDAAMQAKLAKIVYSGLAEVENIQAHGGAGIGARVGFEHQTVGLGLLNSIRDARGHGGRRRRPTTGL